jgi:hypothetical protein
VTSAPETEAELRPPFTQIVEQARSGLRRDVHGLVEALDDAELLVPLAREIPGAALGERQPLDGELTLVPHLLPDAEGHLFAAVFTHPEPLEPIVGALEWTTDGQELKLCSLPARLALEMARDVIDEQNVLGVVIDAGSDSELCLTRNEVASILSGRSLPLLAYVAQIPADERERTLVAGSEAPSPELAAVLQAFRAAHPEVLLYRLERTFNADRDLEPHPTLTLRVEPSADKAELFRQITARVEGLLPPPGYLDVLFEVGP